MPESRPVQSPLPLSPPMHVADAEIAASEAIAAGDSGSVHSWDLVTGADGPGTRMTLFLAGCGMRCQYCQNPDTWKMRDGKRHTVDEVMDRVLRYERVMKVTGGGLTISGGEPLLQASVRQRDLPSLQGTQHPHGARHRGPAGRAADGRRPQQRRPRAAGHQVRRLRRRTAV